MQETFIEELELIREDELASELVVEGEFLSETQMIENWGWSQTLCCTNVGNLKLDLRMAVFLLFPRASMGFISRLL